MKPLILKKFRALRKTFSRLKKLGVYLALGSCIFLIMTCQHQSKINSDTSSDPSRLSPSLPELSISQPQRSDVFQAVHSLPAVERDRLLTHLENLAVERNSEFQKQKIRTYIETSLQQYNWQIEEQPFPDGINIIATQPQANPNADKLLIGAHYDSMPSTPGADDNATGVAALLEISRLFQNRNSSKALTLAFFDLEEAGVVGSAAYTSEPENLEHLKGAIILEMLGFTCKTQGCQQRPEGLKVEDPSTIGDFLSIVGDTEHPELTEHFDQHQTNTALKLVTIQVPLKGLLSPIVMRSDHAPFWLKGIGAVMVSDTAFLRNPNYHRPSDTVDSLDLEFLTQSTEVVAVVTARILSQPSP